MATRRPGGSGPLDTYSKFKNRDGAGDRQARERLAMGCENGR